MPNKPSEYYVWRQINHDFRRDITRIQYFLQELVYTDEYRRGRLQSNRTIVIPFVRGQPVTIQRREGVEEMGAKRCVDVLR